MKEEIPKVGRTINLNLKIYEWYKFLERENRNTISKRDFEMNCLNSLITHINKNALTTLKSIEDSIEFKGLKDVSIMALFPEGVYLVTYQTNEGEWIRDISVRPYLYDQKSSNLGYEQLDQFIVDTIREMKL